MVKKFLLFLLVAGYFVCNTVGVNAESKIPKPEGDIYVQDSAKVLSEEEKSELVQLGSNLDQKTKAQIAVLTIPTLNGDSIEEYAVNAFRTYQLGDKKLNNGVLLLLVTKDKKIRIEVGYGLEGALPDGKVGRILDQYAIPYLKKNQANLAVMNTYKELYNEVIAEYHLTDTPKEKANKAQQSHPLSIWKTLLIGIGVVFLIIIDMRFFGGTLTYIILNIFSAFLRGGGGNGGNKGGGGGSSGGGGASRRW